jgi:hypothetical protein
MTNYFNTHQQNISELCNKAEELLLVKDDSDNTSHHIICLIGHHMKQSDYFTFLLITVFQDLVIADKTAEEKVDVHI